MPSRRNARIIFLVSLVVFGLSMWQLAERIQAFNQGSQFLRFHAQPIGLRQFQADDFPPAKLTDHTDAQGRSFVRLDYAGRQVFIPVRKPPFPDAPELSVYDEWMKVLGMTEVEKSLPGDTQTIAKPGSGRVIIVTRDTPPGYDPETWGTVRRNEWVFSFYDLKRDGTVEQFRRRWPRSYRSEKGLQARAASGKPEDDLDRQLAEIPVLKERSTEFFVAMHVIPKLNVPNYKFTDTAFSFRVLSWTAPLAGFSMLGMIVGLMFAVSPRRIGAPLPQAPGPAPTGA